MQKHPPKSAARPARRPTARLPLAWLVGCLMLAGICFGLKGFLPHDSAAASAAATAQSQRAATGRIAAIRIGQWVVAQNPQVSVDQRRQEQSLDRVEPADWRSVSLAMSKGDGQQLDIVLLRPTAWLDEHRVQAGSTVELDLPEMDASGPAAIVSIDACPPVAAKPSERHRLVTGTFAHSSGDVFDVAVEGLPAPIGVTAAHLFWSEDRHDFVPARELRIGEHLRTSSGERRRIASVSPRGIAQPVYNLEVEGEHVYHVSSQHLLVHNNSCVPMREGPTGNKSTPTALEPPETAAPTATGKQLLPGEGAVGTYDDLIAAGTKGDNITPHHIPSANHMRQHGVSKGDGIAINMEHPCPGSAGRHRQTSTYGSRADESLSPRDALGRGVRDAKRIYEQGGLYGPNIRRALRELIDLNRKANPGLFD